MEPEAALPDGVAFRSGTAADWPLLAQLFNEDHRGNGIDERESADNLAGMFEADPKFAMDRDVRIAEAHGEAVGFSLGRVRERDQTLVGETWGAVVPAWRRRGIGSALLRRAIAALEPLMEDDPRPWPRELRNWADDVETGTIALYRSAGYLPIRYGFAMRRPLSGQLPEHPLPAGLELRPATERQSRAIFEAEAEAFRDHWGHEEPTDALFASWYSDPELDPSLWEVAWDGDEIAGVVLGMIRTRENEELGVRRGWLDRVSVRRPWRGRGLAKALCAASFRALRERGIDEAWLGVDGTNPTGALQLYEGLGFHVARRWTVYGRPLDRPAPQGWRSAGDRGTMGP